MPPPSFFAQSAGPTRVLARSRSPSPSKSSKQRSHEGAEDWNWEDGRYRERNEDPGDEPSCKYARYWDDDGRH